ncbi:MAG TPA: GntR family transcriptional regulator [Clostridiaceae bacterium]|nr:GntR family transcriptional regulator [Clostridiaceae bacterium]
MTKGQAELPLYRGLAAELSEQISAGKIPAGTKLPTIRQFAKDKQISVGTAKHTYEVLADSGLISTKQGSGSYVASLESAEPVSRKEQALESIDNMFQQLTELDFPVREIRIFLELKLRQLEERLRNVKVAVVGESPEGRSVILNSLDSIPNVDYVWFILSNLREQPQRLAADFDFVVCEEKHIDELRQIVQGEVPVMQLALTLTADTIAKIGRIPLQTKVGVISLSNNFLQKMKDDFYRYVNCDIEAECFLYSESADFGEFLQSQDIVLVPPHCTELISRTEEQMLKDARAQNVEFLRYDLKVDRGSWLYIADAAEEVYNKAKQKLNRR